MIAAPVAALAARDGFAGLDTPCLILDRAKLEANVAEMAQRVAGFAVRFRPHLKTAKSIDVARAMLPGPRGPAMVSTLAEAEYFAAHGVTDLTYGVGVAPAKLDRLADIERAHGAQIAVLVDDTGQAEAVAGWSAAHGAPLSVYIEIDTDGHRAGVPPHDGARLLALAGRLAAAPGVTLRGVLTHAGASYGQSDPGGLAAVAEAERAGAVAAAEILRAAGFTAPEVSVGSTPTALSARSLAGVTELRAGVYAFGDLVQVGIGVQTFDDIAISVLTTVIGKRRNPDRLLVDAGWMALSRDRGTAGQIIDQGYGLVCDAKGRVLPDLLVLEANQEHGLIGVRPGAGVALPDLPVGARLRILPNHACATAAQHDRYHVLADGRIDAVWPRMSGW